MYYKPREVSYEPFLIFDIYADSKIEYEFNQAIKIDTSIININDMPKMKFGICGKKLDANGNLINRDISEFENAKKKYMDSKFKLKNEKLDTETRQLISNGFIFDNHIFSLSIVAQLNWQNIINMYNLEMYSDSTISTLDSNEYTLQKKDVLLFIKTYITSLNNILSTNRTSKSEFKNSIEVDTNNNLNIIEDYDI